MLGLHSMECFDVAFWNQFFWSQFFQQPLSSVFGGLSLASVLCVLKMRAVGASLAHRSGNSSCDAWRSLPSVSRPDFICSVSCEWCSGCCFVLWNAAVRSFNHCTSFRSAQVYWPVLEGCQHCTWVLPLECNLAGSLQLSKTCLVMNGVSAPWHSQRNVVLDTLTTCGPVFVLFPVICLVWKTLVPCLVALRSSLRLTCSYLITLSLSSKC